VLFGDAADLARQVGEIVNRSNWSRQAHCEEKLVGGDQRGPGDGDPVWTLPPEGSFRLVVPAEIHPLDRRRSPI
jgi:hypothetical protein